MSLRLKSLLIFSAALIVLFGIVLALVEGLIERQFSDVERQTMSSHAALLSSELQEELDPVAATVGDWAPWDELYNYVAGTNPTFPNDNLNERVLANLRIDFFAIWRQDGTLVRLTTVAKNLVDKKMTREALVTAIRSEGLVPQRDIDQPVSGFMVVGRQLVLVSSLPIVRSERSGAPVGTLVGGKIIGADEIARIEESASCKFQFIPSSDTESYPGIEKLTDHSKSDVRIIDSQHIAAAVPIFDTHGNFIAAAELTSSRQLHLQAAKAIRIFLIALASTAAILLFVVWYLLDAYVIHPVRRLSGKLTEAALEGHLPSDLGFRGGDELASLAGSIEDLANTVALAEANYRAIVEDQTDFIFRYLPDGRIMFANTALCRYLDRSRDSLVFSNAGSFVAEEDAARITAAIARLSPLDPVVTLEHRVHTPHNGVAWFRRTDRAIFSEDGKLQELQCVASDITQAQIAHEQLEASETRYRRLFETATDGILIVRQTTHIVSDVNREFCQMLGCARMLIIDRCLEHLPPFRSPKTLRAIGKLFTDIEAAGGVEITISSDKGDRRFLEVTAAFYEASGETVVQLNFRDISRRKHANDELRRLSGHLLRSQDEERRRIARELHDSTAQNLSALQMAITQLEASIPERDSDVLSAMHEIRSLCELSIKEVRTISYLLHPPLLDEVGLLFALRWYVDGFMTRTEKVVHLDLPETLKRLPKEIETTIFRIVQEGLSNFHRHSGSRRAWIRISVDLVVLELVIRDEGRGIAPNPSGSDAPNVPRFGVGISGMRERLRQFNGSLEIKSSRTGTIVRAILPLEIDETEPD